MDNKPLTRAELAALLGISERTLLYYIKEGRLPGPYVTIGRRNFWRPEQVAKHLYTTVDQLPNFGKKK
jgi:excisionase family DNA binding protein